jgi:hypothetical protein
MKDIASFYQDNYKKWYENERGKKQAAKKQVLRNNVYPNDEDIYGRRKIKDEKNITDYSR